MNMTPASVHDLLQISVVICTRNRDVRIVDTIQSILNNTYPAFDVLVFDQSTNDETQTALTPLLTDPRLRFVRSATTGLGLARNLSLELVRGEIVLMTDDDCVVAPDWIAQMAAAHARQPEAAVVFCNVVPGPHDDTKGFIPYTLAQHDVVITNLYDWCAAGAANVGIGAGLGLRRTLVQALGGFDSRLGAGTPLYCAEETDLAVRALLHKHRVYRTTTTYVVHHGFRTLQEGRGLMRGYMLGIAAAYTKLLRCGYGQLILVLLYEFWRTVLYPSFANFVHLRVPPVLGRTTYLIRGFLIAWQIAIDSDQEVFQPLSSAEPLLRQSALADVE